jgi:hypothetical protein
VLLAQSPICRTRDYTLSGPYPLICLTWVALPGAYAPASIALQASGARKLPLHDKAAVLEEDQGHMICKIAKNVLQCIWAYTSLEYTFPNCDNVLKIPLVHGG